MASLGQSQWDSKNCILVSVEATSPIPADDIKDYLQGLVGSLTQVTVKDTPHARETFVYFDNEQAAQSVLGKPYHQIRSQIGYTYNFSVRSCPNIQAAKYMKGDMASADSSETRQSHTGDGASAAMKDWDRKTIKVHGLKLSIQHDAIRSFFENKYLSGGGVTKEVDFDRTKGVAYVTFVHPGVAHTVLDMPILKLGSDVLTVSRAMGKDDTHGLEESRRPNVTHRQDVTHPHDVTHPQDESHRQGELRREDKSRKQAESGTGRNRAAQKEWEGRTLQVTGLKPSTTGDAIVLLFESKLTDDEDNIQRVQRHPNKDVTYVTFTTAEAAQEVLSVPTFSLEGTTLTVRPATGVKPQRLDPVQVGLSEPQDANSAQDGRPRTDDQSGSAKAASHPPEPEKTTRSVVELDLCLLRMLHASRFKTEQEKKFPGMTVTIDTRGRNVTFGGKESDIANAEDAMHRLVDNMKDSSLEMSAELIKLMRGITIIKHMVGVFKKKDIFAVYAAEGDTTLRVFARNEDHLEKAIEVIKKETCNEPCAESTEALQTEEWVVLKQDLQVKHEGLLTITESGDCIVLSGMVEAVAKAKVPIQLFLAASTDVTSDGSTVLNSVKKGGWTVQVVRGDLTTFPADAIVNAANGQLKHDVGLAKAIVDAGGPAIQQACDYHIQEYGSLGVGHVWVSTPGQLPCKKLIHAVGPHWQGGRYNEEQDLRDAVRRSLEAAQKYRLSSIALPALSAGAMGFPIDRCAKIIVRAVEDFLDTHLQTCVKKVSLVHNIDHVLREFCKSLGIMYGAASTRPVGAVHDQPQPSTRQTAASAQLTGATASGQHHPGPTSGMRRHMSTEDDIPIQIGPLKIEIVKGDLAKEHTNAIVNVTDKWFTQTVVMPSTGIAVTGAGDLSCSHIIHVVEAHSNADWTHKIQDVLVEAEYLQMKSVSFPVLGTATTMLDAIDRFTHSNPKHLRLVRIVTPDQTVMESFKEYFLVHAALPHASPSYPLGTAVARSSGPVGTTTEPSSAHVSTFQHPSGATGGAASHSRADTSTRIGALTIEILHGDLTEQRTVAIVNSSDKTFTLCGGASMAIVKAGGQSIMDECRSYGKMPSSGIVVTGAGNLLCHYIIHIDAHMDLTDIISRVLVEAEQLHISSISFPALGTGMLGKTSIEAANIMLDAINCFTVSYPNPQYLKLVKVVIFDKNIMESFRHCFVGQGNASGPTETVFSSSHRTATGRVPPSQGQATTPSTPSHAGQHAPRPAVGAQSRPDSDGAVSNSGRAQGSTERQPGVQVQWMYADDDSCIQCVDVVNSMIERAYQNNQRKVEWQDTAGNKHKVSFKKLVYKMNSTEKKLKCHLVFDGIVLGRWWTDMSSDESIKFESLDMGSSEYKEVKDKFTEIVGKSAYTINHITRIQNPELYRQYILCRDEIGKLCGHLPLVEKYLWHNTSRDLVNDINAKGFRATPILFTSNPSPDKSAARNTTVQKYVYLTRVVTGDCAMGQQGCTGAPYNKVTGRPYDSVRDSITRTYTLFSGYQAYPEYLISFW